MLLFVFEQTINLAYHLLNAAFYNKVIECFPKNILCIQDTGCEACKYLKYHSAVLHTMSKHNKGQ